MNFRSKGPPTTSLPDRRVGKWWNIWYAAYQCRNHHVYLDTELFPQSVWYHEILFEIQVTSFEDNLYNTLAHPLLYKGAELSREEGAMIDVAHGLANIFALILHALRPKLPRHDQHAPKLASLHSVTEAIETQDTQRIEEAVGKLADDLRGESLGSITPVETSHIMASMTNAEAERLTSSTDAWAWVINQLRFLSYKGKDGEKFSKSPTNYCS